jgi:hypothetical protein
MTAMAITASTNAPTAISSVVINGLLVHLGRSPSTTLSPSRNSPISGFHPVFNGAKRQRSDPSHRGVGGRREKPLLVHPVGRSPGGHDRDIGVLPRETNAGSCARSIARRIRSCLSNGALCLKGFSEPPIAPVPRCI